MKPAVFIDRDGTLNKEVDYLCRPEDALLTRDAAKALARLNALGIPVVVVSNQAGIGRGMFSWSEYNAVMERLTEMLAAHGAHFDAAYACAHHPEGIGTYQHPNHPDRKPNPGMLLRAAQEHDIDLLGSWMIGDKEIDLEAGRHAGCRVALVRTGYGAEMDASKADLVAEDLAEAIDRILEQWP